MSRFSSSSSNPFRGVPYSSMQNFYVGKIECIQTVVAEPPPPIPIREPEPKPAEIEMVHRVSCIESIKEESPQIQEPQEELEIHELYEEKSEIFSSDDKQEYQAILDYVKPSEKFRRTVNFLVERALKKKKSADGWIR
jgi:hypothetical protein